MKTLLIIHAIFIVFIILTGCSDKKKENNNSMLNTAKGEEKNNLTTEVSMKSYEDSVQSSIQNKPIKQKILGIWKQTEMKRFDDSFSSLCFVNDTLLLGDFPEAQEPRYLYRSNDSLTFIIKSNNWYVKIMEFTDSTMKIETNYPRDTIRKEFIKISNDIW
jgi:hypothetical protein